MKKATPYSVYVNDTFFFDVLVEDESPKSIERVQARVKEILGVNIRLVKNETKSLNWEQSLV